MKTITLKDKMTEAFLNSKNPDKKEIYRIVENFLRKKYSSSKISKIGDELMAEYDFKESAKEINRRNLLNSYVDSLVLSKIREWYRTSSHIDLSSLDETKFRSLVMQVMKHFGYILLYEPGTIDSKLAAIFHRKNTKIALLTVSTELQVKVGIRNVKKLKYMSDYFNCEQALLVTNGDFEEEAKEEASKFGITLLDLQKFIPLVSDLVENRKKEEKQILLDGMRNRNNFFLESVIKSPKAKVQANFINYSYDVTTETITFEGELFNSGKKPVTSLQVEITLFNRYDAIADKKIVPVLNQNLVGGESSIFKLTFENISEPSSINLCRYEIKFDYSNSYTKDG